MGSCTGAEAPAPEAKGRGPGQGRGGGRGCGRGRGQRRGWATEPPAVATAEPPQQTLEQRVVKLEAELTQARVALKAKSPEGADRS